MSSYDLVPRDARAKILVSIVLLHLLGEMPNDSLLQPEGVDTEKDMM